MSLHMCTVGKEETSRLYTNEYETETAVDMHHKFTLDRWKIFL